MTKKFTEEDFNTRISWMDYDRNRSQLFRQEKYNEGYKAKPRTKNPYNEGSPNWYAWNKGKSDSREDKYDK